MNKTQEYTEKKKNNEIRARIDKFQRKGEFRNAVEYCQTALSSDPQNAQLHVSLGDLYLTWHLDIHQSKNYIDLAITEYQRALETDLDTTEIHYKLGVAMFYKGNLDKAIAHFNLCVEADEKFADAYYMLARSHAKKDRLAEAIQTIPKAIQYGGIKTARARFLYSFLLRNAHGKTALKFAYSVVQYLVAMLLIPFEQGAVSELITRLNVLKYFPVILKGFYLEKTKNIHAAIDLYNETLDEIPGFLLLYIILGDAYRSMGKYEESINEYKLALIIDPNSIYAYKSLCGAYEELGDYDNAIDIYRKLISLQPNDAIFHSNLANILYMQGNVKDAISSYQNAITLNPNNSWTSVIAQTLGFVQQMANRDYDAAISAYQSAFALNPKDIDIYVSLGSVFYDKEDYDNAQTVYRIALEISPNNPRIHCNLAYLLWGKGELTESIREYEKAISLDPTYDVAYNNLGVIYLDDLGKINKAVELFEEAIKHNPNYALAYYNIARALTVKNDKLEAARLYQIALDINSITHELDDEEIKQRINELFD